jgi:hypothetical protein
MENGNAPLDSDFLQTDLPMFNPVDKSALGLVTKRPGLQDGRKPGLIDLRRYMLQMGMSGIQTFMQSPVALTIEDLTAAGVDVAFIGAGTDFQYGRRGAAFGPQWVRASEIYMPPGYGTPHQHTRVDPITELVLADYGDAPVNNMSLYASIEPIRALVREVAETVREAGLEPWSAAGTAERQAWVADLADAGVFGARGTPGFARSADWRLEADRILANTRADPLPPHEG